jgi:hypothetical protein
MKVLYQIKLAFTKLIQVSHKIVLKGWVLLLDLGFNLHQSIQNYLNSIKIYLVDFTTKLFNKFKNSLFSAGLFLWNLVKHATLNIFNLGLTIVQFIFHQFSKNIIKTLSLLTSINKIILISALFFLISIIPAFLYLWTTESELSGDLTVQQVEFTYQSGSSLLKGINRVKSIEIRGGSEITLSGVIQEPEIESEIKNKINTKEGITFKLGSPETSRLSLQSLNPTDSEMVIEDLCVIPGTHISNFFYNQGNINKLDDQRFEIGLNPSNNKIEQSSGGCKSNFLKLGLGKQPVQVTVENATLVNPNLEQPIKNLQFNLQPRAYTRQLPIISKSTLYIDLPPESPAELDYAAKFPEQSNSSDWLGRRLEVSDLSLERVEEAYNPEERIKHSNLIKGQLVLNQSILEIEQRQFLCTEGSGIETIEQILIVPDGLKLNIRGKVSQLKTSFNASCHNSIVSEIRSNKLFTLVSKDTIELLLIPFASAAFGSLIVFLVQVMQDLQKSHPKKP